MIIAPFSNERCTVVVKTDIEKRGYDQWKDFTQMSASTLTLNRKT